MKKTYTEILEILKSNFITINYFIDEWYDEYDDCAHAEEEISNSDIHKNLKSTLGNWKEIYVSGGSDSGSNWIRVYYFENHDVYMQVNAYYSSYEGVEIYYNSWNSNALKEVRPKEVIKVIYE